MAVTHEELMKLSEKLSHQDRLVIYKRALTWYGYQMTGKGICVCLLRGYREFMSAKHKSDYNKFTDIFMESMPVIFHELAEYRPEMQTDDDYWWPLTDTTTRLRVLNEIIAKLEKLCQ